MQERFRATKGRGGEKRREAETNVRNTCRPNVNLSSFSSSFFFSVLKQINKRNEKRIFQRSNVRHVTARATGASHRLPRI